MSNSDKEIEKILTSNEEVPFEEMPSIHSSPLSQPIRHKDGTMDIIAEEEEPNQAPEESESNPVFENQKMDAPEQDIDENATEFHTDNDDDEFELSDKQARDAADSYINVFDKLVLEGGAGHLIRIKMEPEFYEEEEIADFIEEQNEKNIGRIKLSKSDKAMIRVPLMQVLKQKAKVLSPMQQLILVSGTIVFNTARNTMQIKAENTLLVERLIHEIKEKRYDDLEEDEDELEEPIDEKDITDKPEESKESKIAKDTKA